jgi:hypothetical protein
MAVNDGGPAFPQAIDDMGTLRARTPGMTLRQWYAGMAMQGIQTACSIDNAMFVLMVKAAEVDGLTMAAYLSREAFVQADAMIAEEEKKI